MIKKPNSGFGVWITGLPGCGKSRLAKGVVHELRAMGLDAVRLSMDERRRAYVPEPKYTEEEREAAYGLFAAEAAALVAEGKAVVMDGSAYRLAWRRRARELIPRFCEIRVACPLAVAIERETHRQGGEVMARLYEQALRRKETGEDIPGLGQVIGVDVDFEDDPAAELTIDNTALAKEETLARAMAFLRKWFAGS